MKARHPHKSDLREGQYWDEVGSAVVNAQSRKIIMLGSQLVTYETECDVQHTVKIESFLRWAQALALCSTCPSPKSLSRMKPFTEGDVLK